MLYPFDISIGEIPILHIDLISYKDIVDLTKDRVLIPYSPFIASLGFEEGVFSGPSYLVLPQGRKNQSNELGLADLACTKPSSQLNGDTTNDPKHMSPSLPLPPFS